MNDTPSRCPDCGAALPADSPQALCPACLMRQALASRTLVEGDHRAPAGPPLTPEELAEKFPGYEILECLGRGGMGVVYKARQKSLDRIVAIKILPPERVGEARFSDRFAIEAATLAKLSHPNIVTVHDFGIADSQPSTLDSQPLYYIVMEYVDGVNLRDLLREGKLEPQQALAIVPPICDALQYAHDKGIVHRDIKPENLLLDRGGRIKIADFGIASLMGAAGEIAGTPPYMAPEQNGANIDHRADIYALGVVLYEMLTGQRPEKDLIAPSRKVQIDVRLDEMVLRALEKEPERRYQTAGEFRTVVETVAAAPSSAQEASARRKKRRKKVVFRLFDPLPCKSDLLRMALTMMLAGLAIIALMDGTWEKAREWIDRTFYPGDTAGEHFSRNVLILSCLLIFTALVWKLLRGLGREAGGNRGSGIKLVWLALGLAALFLVFYNPWGPAAWQWMIAAAALSSIGDLLFSRDQVPESGGRPPGAALFAVISVAVPLVLAATGDARAMMAGAGILLVAGLLWFARGKARLALLVALAALGVAGGVVLLLNRKQVGKNAPALVAEEPIAPGFGPVVERVLPFIKTGTACFLDLDQDLPLSPPDSVVELLKSNDIQKTELDKDSLDWLRNSGADVSCDPFSGRTLCVFSGVICVTRSGLEFEDYSPETVRELVLNQTGNSDPKAGVYSSVIPEGAFAFVTMGGAAGVLEVRGVSEEPAGMRIRYKPMKGIEVPERVRISAAAMWNLPPLEPVAELGETDQPKPRQAIRLTVEPRDGHFILATIREYEGHEVVGKDTPVKSATSRLLRVAGNSHAEDIFLKTSWVQRPGRKNPSVPTAVTDRSIITGFGQQITVSGLDYSGASGGSSRGGMTDGKQWAGSARRRFRFTDYDGDPSRTRIVEFELITISREDAAARAKAAGITLPDDRAGNWSATLDAPTGPKTGSAGPREGSR